VNPSDWVADCMVPDAWMHQPFAIDGMAVACDGQALVALPGLGRRYQPPRFDSDNDATTQIQAALAGALNAPVMDAVSLEELPLKEEHLTRLTAVARGIRTCTTEKAVYFHHHDTATGALKAFGVIYTGSH